VNGHDRALRMALVAYVAALRRLDRAMANFDEADVPLSPDRDGRVPPWTAEQQVVMAECAEAWAAVVKQRRAHDVAVREAEHPETWRHA
jgi:hypothetical protein